MNQNNPNPTFWQIVLRSPMLLLLAIILWPFTLMALLIQGGLYLAEQNHQRQGWVIAQNAEMQRCEDDRQRASVISQRIESGGSLPAIVSPVLLAKDETCHYIAPAGLCAEHPTLGFVNEDQGSLVLTSVHLHFVGQGKSLTTRIDKIVTIVPVGGMGVAVHTQTRQRRDIYATPYPMEFAAFLLAMFQQRGLTPPIHMEQAYHLANGRMA